MKTTCPREGTMGRSIDNTEDVIDSRDIIERIEELEGELTAVAEDESEDSEFSKEWVENAANDDAHTFQDSAQELLVLWAVAAQGEDSPDWSYGETLIRESYFQDYAMELAEDIGAIPKDLGWPCNCIDWEQATEQLKQDYSEIDYDGVTYFIRA